MPRAEAAWLKAAGFAAKAGELLLVPGADGAIAAAVFGLGKGGDPLALAACAEKLPAGIYVLATAPEAVAGAHAALAWLLGTYQFTRYRKTAGRVWPRLVLPAGVDGADVSRIAEGVFLGPRPDRHARQ